MKILRITIFLLAAIAFAACDSTTDEIGSNITNKADLLDISQSIYHVTTESLAADSVLSNSNTGLIGKVKDPETGAYLTGDYMTQFGVLSTFDLDTLQYIRNANDGKIEADSCFILVSYESAYGDTLAPMKVKAYQMTKMMPDGNYYSNYDAFKEGYVSEKNYSSTSNYVSASTYSAFKIYLNKPYTASNGVTYKNYGSYIMNTYVEHPEYFKSSIAMMQHVCPGFYIKHEGGVGNITKVVNTELQFFWKIQKTVKASDGVTDSIVKGVTYDRFDGTEEVLQVNKITNDKSKIAELASDKSCTYLKSPAGIFTVATLPVEDIMKGHENDTINTASISFTKLNDKEEFSYNFDAPSTIMMIPLDSIHSFFEHRNITNNRTSYTASYSSSGVASYTFSNISNLITAMYKSKGASCNWDKVVLIPVTVTTVSRDGSTVISKINHDMTLTSARLMRGTAAKPIELKVIYSKFKHN